MVPALRSLAQAAAIPKTRFGIVSIPNGVAAVRCFPKVARFFPRIVASRFEFPPILKPLGPFKTSLRAAQSSPSESQAFMPPPAPGDLHVSFPNRHRNRSNFALPKVILSKAGESGPILAQWRRETRVLPHCIWPHRIEPLRLQPQGTMASPARLARSLFPACARTGPREAHAPNDPARV
jgi:hypothetical protein